MGLEVPKSETAPAGSTGRLAGLAGNQESVGTGAREQTATSGVLVPLAEFWDTGGHAENNMVGFVASPE